MSDNGPDPKDEWATLGRGIKRTFLRDLIVTAIGAVAGAALGVILALLSGLSLRFGLLGGALIGMILALSLRSLTSPLFDYDSPPPEQDKKD